MERPAGGYGHASDPQDDFNPSVHHAQYQGASFARSSDANVASVGGMAGAAGRRPQLPALFTNMNAQQQPQLQDDGRSAMAFTDGGQSVFQGNSNSGFTESVPTVSNVSSRHSTPTVVPTPSIIPQLPADLRSKYRLENQLGKGGSGFVFSAIRQSDGKRVAIKFLYRSRVPTNRLAYDREFVKGGVMVLPMEIYILRRLRHPNVIEFVEFSCDRTFFYLITELHGTTWPSSNLAQSTGPSASQLPSPFQERPMDLFECIETRGPMSEPLALYVFQQVVEACRYLKSMNVWHMDIKDENIVIDTDYRIKIIDFGSANIIPAYNSSDSESGDRALFRRFYGTLVYAPPEVLQSQAYRADQAEIWCMGVLLYTLLFGEPPFRTADAAVREPFPRPIQRPVSDNVWRILEVMLRKEPRERPSLDEILTALQPLCPTSPPL